MTKQSKRIRKKKSKKVEEKESIPEPVVVSETIPSLPKIQCSCVGVEMIPSGQHWTGVVEKSRLVNGQLLLYFNNGKFTCDNRTCRVVPTKKESS